jgi:hypothetical protein
MSHWLPLVASVFSGIAAVASWRSALLSRRGIDQAKRIADDQAKTSLTTARANALASRIAFYNEQLGNVVEYLRGLNQARPTPDGAQAARQKAENRAQWF